jgi:hypothetical protein
MKTQLTRLSSAVLIAVACTPLSAADAPKVRSLRVQKVDQTTYFHVHFDNPADLRLPPALDQFNWWNITGPELTRWPRLVPQDDKTRTVYVRPSLDGTAANGKGGLMGRFGLRNLEFVGKIEGKDAKLLLLYPAAPAAAKDDKESTVARLLREQGSWSEAPVVLDFSKADKVNVPANPARQGKMPTTPGDDDLEGLWAVSQAAHFAALEAQAPDFGFYSFARETTGRRYNVPSVALPRPWSTGGDLVNRRVYELTTGATAITESLALNRLRNRNFRDKDPRTVDIATVRGIEIAEHPWEKMMAGQKPSPEPLARMVPHDNYYLHFKNIARGRRWSRASPSPAAILTCARAPT